MKHIYKHLSICFAILIILSNYFFVFDFFSSAQATAGYSKSINGIVFPLSGSDLTNAQNGAGTDGSQCWGFATWIYKRLFGMDHLPYTYNNSHFVTSYGSTIPTTADNLKNWILRAGPGAVLRVCNTSSPAWDSDGGSGHSLVIIDANESGAWTYQSGSASKVFVYDTSVSTAYAQYRNEVQFNTWSEMSKMLTSGPATSNGQYIKYILCPPENRGFNTDPASNFRFRDVTYPKTFKIDTTNGWSLGSGIVESNYTLTSVRSEILNSSGGAVSDSGTKSISGYSYSIKAFDDYSGTNNGVRFSWISSAGNYTWRLTATDSGGRTLVMDMPFTAVSSGSTSTATMSKEYSSTISVTGVTVDLDSVALWEGETTTVTSTVSPSNATNSAVTWTSSNTAIATVTPVSGNARQATIKAVKAGTVTITCTTSDGGKKATCAVTVKKHATGIELSPATLQISVGGTSALTANVLPSDATNKTVHWSSDDTSIATVNNGTIKGIAAGTTTISAMAEDGGYTKKCTVTVVVPVSSITLSKSSLSLAKGNSADLTYTVSPTNATNKNVIWSSNNTSVATVNGGVVKAVGVGNATITCSAADGSDVSATCKVTVNEPIPELILPAGLTEVEEEAFAGIDAQRITLPNGVKKIGKRAFAGCAKLKYIYIPAATTQIAGDAFTGVASGFEIHGKLNSYAQTYAAANGYTFIADDACTITFNANGGSCSTTSKTIGAGATIGTLPTASRSYYTFNGWYTAASGGSKVSASSTFSSSTTLYARWTEHEWSDWVTEDQLPSGTMKKESKQQYRYQDKVYSDWSDWGSRTETRESTGELKKERQLTEHYWYYDLCQNCGRHSPYTTCWDCGHSIGQNWRVTWLDTSRNEGAQFGNSDKIFTMTDEGRWFYWTDDNGNGDSRTVYQYATRTFTWGNWSEWSDTLATASATRNVDERYVYRYKLP